MTRNEVLTLCYRARTLPQIETAKLARGRWLREHPDDAEVLEVGGRLSRLEDAIRLTEANRSQAPATTPAA